MMEYDEDHIAQQIGKTAAAGQEHAGGMTSEAFEMVHTDEQVQI